MVALPFNIFIVFIALDATIGILGIVLAMKKIAGAPFVTLFAGILMFGLVAVTSSITVGYSDAQPSNTTQSGGILTCTTTSSTICTPSAITKSFSYFNSTGQITNKPDPIPNNYNIQNENSWVYLILLAVFWVILSLLVQYHRW